MGVGGTIAAVLAIEIPKVPYGVASSLVVRRLKSSNAGDFFSHSSARGHVTEHAMPAVLTMTQSRDVRQIDVMFTRRQDLRAAFVGFVIRRMSHCRSDTKRSRTQPRADDERHSRQADVSQVGELAQTNVVPPRVVQPLPANSARELPGVQSITTTE